MDSDERKTSFDREQTQLSGRDRQIFVEMLSDESTRPNDALVMAVRRYKEQVIQGCDEQNDESSSCV